MTSSEVLEVFPLTSSGEKLIIRSVDRKLTAMTLCNHVFRKISAVVDGALDAVSPRKVNGDLDAHFDGEDGVCWAALVLECTSRY